MKLNDLILGLVVLLVFTSCSISNDETPEPITKANIIGSVNLYDEGVSQIDNSNMTVKIEGSSPLISTTTDVNGDFILADVPFGTYTLVYMKTGFGTFKKFGLVHANTGSSTIITGAPSLGEVSSTQITDLEANASGDDITLAITTNPAGSNGNSRYVRYFLGTDSNVSNENYIYHSQGLISQINPFETTLTRIDLIGAGFSSGETVYVKAYGDSFWSNEYDDPDLNRKVFPNLNATSANAVSFVVP
ncbi:carboxypeptidase-like regulatory domain-containing protein [Marinifilum flexuosum]|uniref:Carboxypeptidase family protein n=1 Tax=Marinifilum flexuosum TaxID=1117708 RepID=A0A419X3A3_9BACT|nr:carboxypeptidase-like regulatory domain-containing protein [Marinifilum flexuosum]RKE02099.1 hypothetical protein BXY64_2180 [Marinifilum flexuosum]